MKNRRKRRNRRGVSLVYAMSALVIITGFVSMGVDYARVQVAKTELLQASDSAARYGASALKNILNGVSAAKSNAVAAAADNTVDGTPLTLDPTLDVQLGIWTAATKTFVVTTDPYAANAVRVYGRRVASRGTGIPMMFARLLQINTCDVNSVSIATLTPGEQVTVSVPATKNPFLSGMPAGSKASLNNPHNNPDTAGTSGSPLQSPALTGITVNPGSTMSFDGVNGNANNDINDPARYSADGNTSLIVNNTNGSENGISDIRAPINALVGVFLDANTPTTGSTPATLDFGTAGARDFQTLSPKLKQIFFIGDGRNSDGETQSFVVPAGAKRLFITTWDSYEWNNNVGSFTITVHRPGTVSLVK